MPEDVVKAPWPSKWGTIAQMVSAGSSILFGLSAAVISYNTWNLQNIVANDAALSRDNENLNRLTNFLIQDGERFDTSNRCLAVLIWYVDHGKIKKIRLAEDRDSLFRDFSQPADDKETETKRQTCISVGQSKFLSTFFFMLNIQETALANYTADISLFRKKIYYKQLRVLSCTNYTNVNILLKKYDSVIGGVFARGFPNITGFVGECEANEKLSKA